VFPFLVAGSEGAEGSLVIQRLASSAPGIRRILGYTVETLGLYAWACDHPGLQAATW